jgi:hypothetical protein
MVMNQSATTVIVIVLSLVPAVLHADKRGQAAVATEDQVPIYSTPTAQEPKAYLQKGQPFGAQRGALTVIGGRGQYIFDERDGRVFGRYFPAEDQKGKYDLGWVDPAKLAKFYYDCSCAPKEGDCTPTDVRGLRLSFIWNSCFMEAWEAKKAELEAASAAPASASTQETVEERLKKLEELFKKGLITVEEYEAKRAEILRSF